MKSVLDTLTGTFNLVEKPKRGDKYHLGEFYAKRPQQKWKAKLQSRTRYPAQSFTIHF